MTTYARLLAVVLVAFMATLVHQAARAELPPGSYDKLRAEAPEALVIEVSSVEKQEIEPGKIAVTVEASVLAVERSKDGVKKGDKITIKYTHIDTTVIKNWAGPRPIPILAKGGVYPAFLKKDGKVFTPVAHGESFRMTPEG